jgi:hypothetical protein
MTDSLTFLEALVAALERAGQYNKHDQEPPAAVLWPDKEHQWEALLPLLRDRLPLLTLGPYAPAARTGPAYYLRCMIAHTLDDKLPPDVVPIIYLPGVSRQELRAIEECPKPLQPLTELQYSGVLWTHKNGRDWTIAGFLQTGEGGLGIEVGADQATRQSLVRTLLKLADEPVEHLKKEAPLRAPFLDSLLNPDETRNLLRWLDDSVDYPKRCGPEEWASFRDLCKRKYDFDPEKDGPITAAQLLGQKQGVWETVWRRFAESARAYPNVPELLRSARPQLSFFDLYETWPQDNEQGEKAIRERLTPMVNTLPDDVRAVIQELEKVQGPRRKWVWAELGQSPLAVALQHLMVLAQETKRVPDGATTTEIAAAYAEWGWPADAAVMDALAAVKQADDVKTVKAAIAVLYRPWLEKCATALQKVVAAGDITQTYPRHNLPAPGSATCLVFSDALRFDVGQRLVESLENHGLACEVKWSLVALPSVTATAKPAISPVAELLSGAPSGLDAVVTADGTRVNAPVLRKMLEEAGYEVLLGDDLGDPAGKGWTEFGQIDTYGHAHGCKLAYQLTQEIDGLEQHIEALLDWGWGQVVVVTDHGWLLLPGGLPKAELPAHLTELRKGRCARLKVGANTGLQTVPWHWDSSVNIALATGIGCFEAGKEYEHGGLSPQECVVPVITVSRLAAAAMQPVTLEQVMWKGLRCSLQVTGATPDLRVDIRSKAADPATSLVAPRAPGADGAVSVLVENEEYEGSAAFIVAVTGDGTIRAQMLTTVGG